MAMTGMEWAQGQVDPDPYEYNEFGRYAKPAALESLQDVVFGHGSNPGSQLPHEEFVNTSLQAIAQQAGLPAGFDWMPHLANAAMQFQQGRGGYDIRSDNSAALIKGAVESAVQQYPQLQQVVPQLQEGSPIWQQGEEIRVRQAEFLRDRKKSNFNSFLTNAALAFGGGALLGGMSGGAAAGTEASSLYGAGGEFGAGATTYGGGTAGAAGGGATLADTAWGVNPIAGDTAAGGVSTYGGSGLSTELAMGAPEAAGTMGLPGSAAAGAYKFPWYDAMKGALGLYFSKQQAKDLQGAIGQAADRADPFYAQRPQYQEQFRGLTSSPSAFFEDPAIADIIGFQTGATERRLASQGYNMSGNFGEEVARTGMREAFGQYMPYSRMIGEAAGAFQGTQGAGNIMGEGAMAGNKLQGQQIAGLGQIFENIYRGQQPTVADQARGTSRNQNLYEAVFL